MGEPITRLNPLVESRVQRILLTKTTEIMLSIAMLFPKKEHMKKASNHTITELFWFTISSAFKN